MNEEAKKLTEDLMLHMRYTASMSASVPSYFVPNYEEHIRALEKENEELKKRIDVNEAFNKEISQDFESALDPRPDGNSGNWIERVRQLRKERDELKRDIEELVGTQTMAVTPYDRLRFEVASETNPTDKYLVDLSEDPYTCQCLDFLCRHKNKLKATCKHIRRTKKYLARQVVEALREQENV